MKRLLVVFPLLLLAACSDQNNSNQKDPIQEGPPQAVQGKATAPTESKPSPESGTGSDNP